MFYCFETGASLWRKDVPLWPPTCAAGPHRDIIVYFDYDFVFYDNIHYFLQEYEAWEKTFTSEIGAINEFDNENYLQFLAGGNDLLRSSNTSLSECISVDR